MTQPTELSCAPAIGQDKHIWASAARDRPVQTLVRRSLSLTEARRHRDYCSEVPIDNPRPSLCRRASVRELLFIHRQRGNDTRLLQSGAHMRLPRRILETRVGLSARDAIHAAIMNRFEITEILTFDHGFDLLPGVRRIC